MRRVSFKTILLLGLLASSVQADAQSVRHGVPAPVLRPDVHRLEGVSVLHRDRGRGVPRLALARAPAPAHATTPEEAAWAHLRRLAPLYQLEDALDLLSVRAVHEQRIGPVIVAFEARIQGIPVFLDELRIAMSRDLSLLGASGSLSPHLARAARSPLHFRIGPEQAIAHAWRHVEASTRSPALRAGELDDAGMRRFHADGAEAIRAGSVLFDRGDALLPAFYVELIRGLESRSFVVDARNGAILFSNELAYQHGYRVWADEDDAPLPSPAGREGFPSRGLNEALQIVPTRMVELDHGPISTRDPWLPTSSTEATGNNVEVHSDIKAMTRPLASPPGVFDHPFATDQGPVASHDQLRATLTHLFYTANWLHDWLYDAGFDEAWGNAQESNYGRGGAEGDRLLANNFARDIPNNAYIIVTADGKQPVMKFGITRRGGVERDMAQDTSVIAHEYGHLLSSRLIGDGNGLRSLQSRSMGEGWADFLALLLLVRPEDASIHGNERYEGAYPVGIWGTNRPYYGVRRYPYSSNASTNPLSLEHITDHAQLGFSPPQNPNGRSNAETHNAGEVWGSMLWQLFTNLLRDHQGDFEEVRELMLHLLVASLKLTPPNPTFIEGRDALVLAAMGFDDRLPRAVMVAFAERGAGLGAVAPHRLAWGNRPAQESFDYEPNLYLKDPSIRESIEERCDLDEVVDVGEIGVLHLTVANGQLDVVNDIAVEVTPSAPGIRLLTETPLLLDELGPLQTAELSVEFSLEETDEPIPLVFEIGLAGRGRPVQELRVEGLGNFDGCWVDELGVPRWGCEPKPEDRECVNRPPIVVADVPAHILGGASAEAVVVSIFDPDGDDVSLQWSIQGGPYTYEIEIDEDDSGERVRIHAPRTMSEDLAVLYLRYDDGLASGVHEFEIVIHPAPPSAIAHAEPETLNPGETGRLVGEGINPRQSELLFQWVQIEGPSVVLGNPDQPTTTFTAPSVLGDTTLKFALTVTNDALESEAAIVEVLVRPLPIGFVDELGRRPPSAPPAPRGPKPSGCSSAGGADPASTVLLVLTAAWRRIAASRRRLA